MFLLLQNVPFNNPNPASAHGMTLKSKRWLLASQFGDAAVEDLAGRCVFLQLIRLRLAQHLGHYLSPCKVLAGDQPVAPT